MRGAFSEEVDLYASLVTHVFGAGDAYLDSDVVFGVKQALIAPFDFCPAGTVSDGRHMVESYYRLRYDFALAREC